MSKKWKRQHARAMEIAVAPTRAQRKVPTHPVMPSRCRDPLFGTPLERGTPRLPMLDYDRRRPKSRWEPIPLAIHMHQPEDGRKDDGTLDEDRLGSPKFAPPFVRYLRALKQLQAARWHEWYRQPDILRALASHAETGKAPFTLDELNATVVYLRGGDFSAWNHVPFWFEARSKRVTEYVRVWFPDRRQFAS